MIRYNKRKDRSEITFTVTQNDIKNGKRKDPRLCPIARAINRTLSRQNTHHAFYGYKAYINRTYLELHLDDKEEADTILCYGPYKTPKSVHDLIARFD